MGRPTVYGKEVRINSQGKCVGINLGYNFYSEHEGDTVGIVQSCNNEDLRWISLLSCAGYKECRKEITKLKRQRKLNEKLVSRWNNTPFRDHVFMPSVSSMLRMIVIDNSAVRQKYSNVLLNDGHYYLLAIGEGFTSEMWEKKFGRRKTVSEEDIFYMPDYQRLGSNLGYLLNNGYHIAQVGNFGACWAIHSNYLFIVLPAEQKSYLEDIQSALKAGTLACVPCEQRLFRDRGCCLIDLETAYFGVKWWLHYCKFVF